MSFLVAAYAFATVLLGGFVGWSLVELRKSDR